MLSLNLLEKLFDAQRFDRLLEGVVENGLPLPLPLRARLAASPVACAALGLRRLVELTYRPTTLSNTMTRYLLEAQDADGSYAGDPLATAAAVAALAAVRQDHQVDDLALLDAQERALAALSALQDDDGLFRFVDDRSEDQRALAGAFVLWLLGTHDAFRATVRLADLLNWFEDREADLPDAVHELWRMARAGQPALAALAPAFAA